MDLILWILAAICFGLAAFKVTSKYVEPFYLGWMFVALTFIL